MKVIYTSAADFEMQLFQDQQKKNIEKLIIDKKSVYGDDVIEITASDIKEIIKYFDRDEMLQISETPRNRVFLAVIVSRLYVVFGVITMVVAYFYPTIYELYIYNQIQAMVFIMGAVLALIGVLAGYWLKFRSLKLIKNIKNKIL